ncbi:DUF4199 domain-containing protein [Polaribacter sp. WD7]|uniref:DUF4199 domain-containing protein n=1 Tax=Polaribacter sp. WD7 TaxID=2269061 RepID=UPI000DF3714B|nr:DUF4199 domain-containing protein [Polaribacter sp. WD7]RCS27345.1 DUF4199 domain-containing protein [Polaribacter sp. WD7]
MENQANSKGIILNHGLYYGLASVLTSVILYALGKHLEQGLVSSLIGIGIMILFIVLAMKKFKTNNNGFMSWGQGVKVGLGTIMVGVLIAIIYQQIFINFIEPDFMNQLMEVQQQQLTDAGLTEEQIEAQMEMGKNFQGPGMMAAFALLGAAFLGFVFSAITAAIMKKSEEEAY